ncbi:EH domain-containing protein 1 isoform X2 [Aethina tumida]|nr:EH domain-containing protein 1 isoform X2 [Aethina tumida]
MYDKNEGMIPGNALIVDPKRQFKPLAKFGNSFLNRFQCSLVNSPVLRNMTIIDTPGILSGEKQRIDRGYDFIGVLEWFAERVDRIILLFDAHKLDISDEFRRAIEALRGHDDKIRIVLNKADMIDSNQLLRVYGAMMWSLGKVLRYPEVSRVYIGSFWDQPLQFDCNRKLFEEEEQNLFRDLQSLPRNTVLRRLNDLIKRARMAKVHAYIISELKKDMPIVFRKDSKKTHLIKHLSDVFVRIQRQYMFPAGDFPDITKMQSILIHQDFNKFPTLNKKLIDNLDDTLNYDISSLMSKFSLELDDSHKIEGGAFARVTSVESPFGYMRGEGVDAGSGETEWVVSKDKLQYDQKFIEMHPVDGKITASVAKEEMIRSKLPNSVLSKIWKLSDIDKDDMLDSEEFALAMHLIKIKVEGNDLPAELPAHLVPPSRRIQ